MYLQASGFVLKYRNWREGDRIYTIYTDRIGKLDIQARGTRKAQSKLAGQMLPFRLVNFSLVKGRQRYQLIAAQTKEDLLSDRNILQFGYGFYFLELIDELTRVGQRSLEVFEILENGLRVLQQVQSDNVEYCKRLRVAFLLKVLEVTGFNPEERVERGDPIQGILEKYLRCPLSEVVKFELNGELKVLFNISQYGLNEVIEKPLKSVRFLQKLT